MFASPFLRYGNGIQTNIYTIIEKGTFKEICHLKYILGLFELFSIYRQFKCLPFF